ncbi:hypothetical protein FH581_018850 [Leptospira weilii]|nr:hypothetical protein [Leptospira weilii]MDL5245749.1 hypothetical protein [Leptospira weilii]QDK25721.1 hypothetical protein FHG68_02595 [Leptospira weilii]ULH28356.1 hypothetical protein FH586_18815 [Leptospira weilii]UPY80074.1 hypothetical protein FH581_018850 [Leptospira weilii]
MSLFIFYLESYLFNYTTVQSFAESDDPPHSERIQDRFDKRNPKKEFIRVLQEFNNRFHRFFPVLIRSLTFSKIPFLGS